jgi:hypothetical protein
VTVCVAHEHHELAFSGRDVTVYLDDRIRHEVHRTGHDHELLVVGPTGLAVTKSPTAEELADASMADVLVLSRLLCRIAYLLIIANKTTLRHVANLPYSSEHYSSESFASSLRDGH